MTGARFLKRLLAGLAGVAFLFIVGLIVLQVGFMIHQARLVYPRPETQSTFFKNYSPAKTIEAFDLKQGSSNGEGLGSSAGHEFVSHERKIYFQFFVNAQQRDALAAALAQDVSAQLLRSGATIVATEYTADGSVAFRYVSGHTQGEAVVEPIKTGGRDYPLPFKPQADRPEVMARVNIEEKWYKSMPASPPSM
jgi:hypothetical protein